MYLAVTRLAGLVSVADRVKATTPEALGTLKERLACRDGDWGWRDTAAAVARRLGIDEFYGEVKPQENCNWWSASGAGQKVSMAGDGINDAPALAKSDVGIAMGTSTDVAMHSAGVTLVKGDLAGIALRACAIARHHAQYPAKSGARLCLQCAWHSGCGRRALSGYRPFCSARCWQRRQ